MGWVVNATHRPPYPRERPGTHCIGGWVDPRAGLNGSGKSRPHRDSIPGPSSPLRVAIPTALSRPLSRGVAPPILNLGTTCRWMVSFTPRPLYPLNRRLGGLQDRSGRFWRRVKSPAPESGRQPAAVLRYLILVGPLFRMTRHGSVLHWFLLAVRSRFERHTCCWDRRFVATSEL